VKSRFDPRFKKSDGGESDRDYFARIMTPELAAFIPKELEEMMEMAIYPYGPKKGVPRDA
jgi:hypothetical protein